MERRERRTRAERQSGLDVGLMERGYVSHGFGDFETEREVLVDCHAGGNALVQLGQNCGNA